MARYMVITKLTDKDGTHDVGAFIDVDTNDSAEEVALARLIEYGILTEATEPAKKTSRSTGSK